MEDFFADVADRWPRGREDYHWHVLPGTELARDHLARPYRELTAWPGLMPVRPEHMHVTVQHLAPTAEITSAEVEAIATLVAERCAYIAPFAVTASRAQAWETSIVCPLRPGYLLATLWQVTTSAAMEITGGRLGIHPAVYHPHLTLAYATARVDTEPMRAWLADCDAGEVALPITRLALVAQRHDGREITFRVLRDIPLADAIT
jgi:2'-5' RNA ligase